MGEKAPTWNDQPMVDLVGFNGDPAPAATAGPQPGAPEVMPPPSFDPPVENLPPPDALPPPTEALRSPEPPAASPANSGLNLAARLRKLAEEMQGAGRNEDAADLFEAAIELENLGR
jgi:hypothetical protein